MLQPAPIRARVSVPKLGRETGMPAISSLFQPFGDELLENANRLVAVSLCLLMQGVCEG